MSRAGSVYRMTRASLIFARYSIIPCLDLGAYTRSNAENGAGVFTLFFWPGLLKRIVYVPSALGSAWSLDMAAWSLASQPSRL